MAAQVGSVTATFLSLLPRSFPYSTMVSLTQSCLNHSGSLLPTSQDPSLISGGSQVPRHGLLKIGSVNLRLERDMQVPDL